MDLKPNKLQPSPFSEKLLKQFETSNFKPLEKSKQTNRLEEVYKILKARITESDLKDYKQNLNTKPIINKMKEDHEKKVNKIYQEIKARHVLKKKHEAAAEKIPIGMTEQTKTEDNTTNGNPQVYKTLNNRLINIPEEKKCFLTKSPKKAVIIKSSKNNTTNFNPQMKKKNSTKRPKKADIRKSSKNNTTNNNNPEVNTTINNRVINITEETKFFYTKKPKKVVFREPSTSPKVRYGGRPSIILKRTRDMMVFDNQAPMTSSSEESTVYPKLETIHQRNRVIPLKQTFTGLVDDIEAGKLIGNQVARVTPTLTLTEPKDDIKEIFRRIEAAPFSPPRGPRTNPKGKTKRKVNEIFHCDSKTSRTKTIGKTNTEVNEISHLDIKASRTKTKDMPETEVNEIFHWDGKDSRIKIKFKPKTEVNEIFHCDTKISRIKIEVNEIFHCDSKASRTKAKGKPKNKLKGKPKTEGNEIFHWDSKASKIDGYCSGPPRPMCQYDQLDNLSIRTRKLSEVNHKTK